ncbi:MAG: Ku protein [Dehalococcoidia bacterium]|nr:Ku protein [Dehalococcoidia bacterium]
MPRSIWKGAISFGLVSIPVKLYAATESKDISFRQIHDDECQSRIRQLRWCPVHEREVGYDEIARGYEYSKDRYVLLGEEDFDSLPLPSKYTINLDAFVDGEEIDPIYYERSYYLEPDEAGAKPFAMLMRALQEKGLVAVAKIAIRNKEQLCALRPQDGVLALETMFLADEIREAPSDVQWQDTVVSAHELAMAETLIEMLHKPFASESYKDEYREALQQVIDARLDGVVLEDATPAEPPKVVDLMAALRASVEAARSATPAPSSAHAEAADDDSKPRHRPSEGQLARAVEARRRRWARSSCRLTGRT